MIEQKQLTFFELLGEVVIEVAVYAVAHEYYRATIAGGWWVAHGATKDEAVKKVVAAYETETALW